MGGRQARAVACCAGGVRRLRGFLSGVAGGGGPGRSEVEDRAAALREIEQKLGDHPV
jgi:hypothetical protein